MYIETFHFIHNVMYVSFEFLTYLNGSDICLNFKKVGPINKYVVPIPFELVPN